jgi:hypothetical protein
MTGKIVALAALCAMTSVPRVASATANPSCRNAIKSYAGISVNGHHEKRYEVVGAAVLNATWPGGSEQAGFAYVYRTQAAGLFLNDAANRWIVPLKSTKLADVKAAYATIRGYKAPLSYGAAGVLSGKAQMSVSDCPANKP